MFCMIKRILHISGKYKRKILWGIFFHLLMSVFMTMMMMAVYVVAENLNTMTMQVILSALGILVASIFGRFLFQWLMEISMSAKGFDMFRDYRLNVGERMRKAPMGYFSEQRLGSIQTVLTSTVSDLEQYSMMAITNLTGGVIMTLVMMGFFLFFNPVFAFVTLVGLCVGISVLHLIQKAAAEQSPKVLAAGEVMTTQALEYIRGISVLRAFSQTKGSEDSVYEAFDQKRQADLNQEHASLHLLKIYSAIFKLTGCVLMFAAVLLYLAGSITLSYCLLFIIGAFMIYSEMEQMGNGVYLAGMVTSGLDRLEAVTDIPKMDTSLEELTLQNFDIELKDVSFAYESRQVINHVSVKMQQGSACAIVGPSGSGKTTLCNLIARFWDVQEGQVLVGGRDVRQYTADSLMKYISMVFQNVYLFQDTIENNIRFGNPEATSEQVVEAAKRAQCHAFISALPEGYETIVGEGGSTLSGGERQRISIARAMLKDAPIIILDEATSGIDPENEHELVTAVQELTKGKTLISIAHRLTTVRNADQILVIAEGTVAQKGTHAQLIEQDGIYRRFWKQREAAGGWRLGS
ncbi:MAG: ABC transporter ATP-binding protein [Lachnospiraceae bacterium]